VAAGGGQGGHAPRAALRRGRHLQGRKYEILKFGRFWPISVGIVYSDILRTLTPPAKLTHFWDHIPTVSAPRPHTKQYVHQETYTADVTDHSPAVEL